ncbi:DNA-binding CsgD family transcriptional regulator [Sphingopyxis panaciterrae]|uniref:helix-turn-helix transcriptional regulator n=1 Tax=Sphingopyxis panaciterrae TaxID=363841 RepID=UPI001ABBDCF7|nr:LuxR C-terminal-related transcriptional regulator [Sphingopyxis panaciterrae]NIJ38474.1 DNA-binding CsgD family transcriptional regulator [Sphingopyxis panaciterrae]
MQTIQSVLTGIIGTIGERDFATNVADALCRFAGFDLAAIIVHRSGNHSAILFENFGAIGHRPGLETYARETYGFNPMLGGVRNRAVRARDYRRPPANIPESICPHLLPAPREELGFRTIGWPERLEEIGLYFPGGEGMVEIGLYRERARRPAPVQVMRALNDLTHPVRAAFERHRALGSVRRPATGAVRSIPPSALTARENEICELLLAGCSSDAIALRLSLSRHTVKDHRKNIFRKLAITSLAELFALAR